MARVVLIDDHEVGRVGRRVMLEELGHQVHACGWRDVSAGAASDPVVGDLTLAVVRADPCHWDRYQALRVLPRHPVNGGANGESPRSSPLGSLGSLGRTVAVVGWGAAANPLVGLRLANRGLNEAVLRSDLDRGEALRNLVAGRLPTQPTVSSAEVLAHLGCGRHADPDGVIERITTLARDRPAYFAAFEPGNRQLDSGLSRRRAHTLRVKVTELGDLLPRTGRGQGGPVRDWSLPSFADVVAFVNLCRGLDARPDVGRR